VRRTLIPAVPVAVAVAVVVLLVYGLTKQGASRALDQAIEAGRHPQAPSTSVVLPVLDGTTGATASLTRWRGRVIVLNFWASWCQPCVDEAPLMARTQRALSASGAGTVIGINYKDVSSDAQTFLARYGLRYPNLRDVEGGFAGAYGTAALPETFVLDRRQRVVAISRGVVTSEAQLLGWIKDAERA
jgi:cytochrome c biogenesis protein CcmG, thiol:disulfide interchange protein DsbE